MIGIVAARWQVAERLPERVARECAGTAEQSGAEVDGAGRVAVLPHLTLPGRPEVHVVGDLAALDDLQGGGPPS